MARKELETVKLPSAHVKKVRKNKKETGVPIAVFICQAIDDKIKSRQEAFPHLEFMYQRLLNKHNENPDVDYMIKFRKIIDSI